MPDSAPQLLLVDDDTQLASMLHEYLEPRGFSVTLCADGESALQQVAARPPDLIVLDVMLPGIDGFEVLARVRAQHDLPVIMLTARGEESDRILGLMRGADDYLPKPFNPLELVMRIRTVLKRARQQPEQPAVSALAIGPVRLDMARRELKVHEQPVALTAAEMRVLEQLLRRPGEVLSRARLTELALDRPIEAYDRSIDTLVSKLRTKLATAGIDKDCIRGLRGHGYVFDSDALEES